MIRGIPSPVGLRAAAAAFGAKLTPYISRLNFKSRNNDFGVKLTPYLFRLNFESRNHDFRAAFPLAWTKVYSTTCSSPCDDATRSIEKSRIDAEAAMMGMSHSAIELDSVVKISNFGFKGVDHYLLPWQPGYPHKLISSGFVISGRRILTVATTVMFHKFIFVNKHHSPKSYRAEVRVVSNECNLAILTIDDENFWEGTNCLEFGNIPFLQDAVVLVGYTGGFDNILYAEEPIWVTKGNVCGIGQMTYYHGETELLGIQIDVPIDSIGCPALMDGKVIGVTLQNAPDDIGCLIPITVVKHFISSIEETGKYAGLCSLDLSWKPITNEQLLEDYRMPAELTGVCVSRINRLSGAYGVLKVDDIILSFDGSTIANDGTVQFRNQDRITFDHLVSMKKPNDSALVKVWRDGEEREFVVAIRPKHHLIPNREFDKHPSYYIFGGLVFVTLSDRYLSQFRSDWKKWPRRLYRASKRQPCKVGQQIVILSQVLLDDINTDYEFHENLQVKKVNGIKVLNLKHMRELVKDGSIQENVRFDLGEKKVIILNYKEAQVANSRVLKRHRIFSAMSDDLADKNMASHPDMMEFS